MKRADLKGLALEIGLLGPVEVRMSGRAITLARQQQRALLALLALNANRIVSTDRLTDALWGADPPPTAPAALYGLVSGLRKLLEPEGARVLVTRAPGYVLELRPESTDVGRFEQLVAEGRHALAGGDAGAAAERLASALALWRGPALQDLAYLPFAQTEIARLEELRLSALEDRIEADLARGRNGDVVPELELLVAEHPLRERPRGQLMRALYASGRQADALAAYREARTILVNELGLEPSEDLQSLERAILRHDLAVAPVAATADGATLRTSRATVRVHRRWIVAAAIAVAVAIATAAVVVAGQRRGGVRIHVAANSVAVIDDGRIVAAAPVAGSPTEIAADAESVWMTSGDEQVVARVDAATGEVREKIPVGSGASGVAADEHAVWVANSLDDNVSRIDPAAEKVVDTIPIPGGPLGVALGRGSVWVASREGQTLWRVDARTGDVRARVPVGTAPRAVAVGAGAVWVVDEAREAVLRVDPDRETVSDTINVGNGPTSVAIGHGAVWVANNLDGTVSRIDPHRDVVTDTIPVGDGPRGLAVTADGVWVSNEFSGTLTLINPRTHNVRRTVRIGQRPAGLATSGGKIVVAVGSGASAHHDGTLRVVRAGPSAGPPIDTLTWGSTTTIYTNDGLVAFRRVGGADSSQLVPDLAVGLPSPTDGGRTYTFRLRAGIRYSDGRLVRPADFRRALERAFIVLRQTIYYDAIIGAEGCASHPTHCDLSRGIVTDDHARTVTFRLRRPDPDFLYKLALPFAFAVPADTPTRHAVTHPLPATGPYMVARYHPRELTLVRNPRFREWSKAAQPNGYPDRIKVTRVASTREAVRATERGNADVAWVRIPPQLQRDLETQYASQLRINPVAGVTYLFLNTRTPPFDDLRARRAVSYAVNRAAGARASTRLTGGKPTCQVLPPQVPGFEPYCPYTASKSRTGLWRNPDLELARQLVARSGTRGELVTIWIPDNHRGEGPFAAALLRSLGYRVHLERVSNDALGAGPTGRWRRVQAGLFSWLADYPAASNYIDFFFSCRAFYNWSGFCDRRINSEIQRALELQTTDPYGANRLWARIDRAIVDDAPVVPLFTLAEADFVSRRVGNYQYSLQWGVLLDQLWVG